MDQFVLAFPDALRTVWSIHCAGFVQSMLFIAIILPILFVFAIAASAPISLFVINVLLLIPVVFLGASVGASFFFVTRRLVPFNRSLSSVVVNLSLLFIGWGLLQIRSQHAGDMPADRISRLLLTLSLLVLWHITRVGWLSIARFVRMHELFASIIARSGAAVILITLMVIPSEVFVYSRLNTIALFFLPFPYLLGSALPDWWNRTTTFMFGVSPSLFFLIGCVSLLYIVLGFGIMDLARVGYERLWRRPETVYEHSVLQTESKVEDQTPESKLESYWGGFRNAVWTREIRGRIRNADTGTFITFTSGVTALAGFLPLFSGLEVLTDPLRVAEVAGGVFAYLTLTEVALVTFIVPGITSEAIGLEREHQTLDLMIATALSPSEVLAGKLMGAVSYMMLLVSPALPLFALCCVFHGATVTQVILVYVLMLASAFSWGALGVTISSTVRTLNAAKYATYALVLITALIPGSPLWVSFYVANPNGSFGGFPLHGVLGLTLAWAFFAGLVLIVQWGRASFEIGQRYGARN